MNVILHSADGQCLHVVFSCDPTYVSPQSILQIGSDHGLAFLCTENDVDIKADVRIGHFQIPLSFVPMELLFSIHVIPTLSRDLLSNIPIGIFSQTPPLLKLALMR
jgi:hypothetical protein